MGMYKLDIRKQYGKFEHRVYKQKSDAPDHAGGDSDVHQLVTAVGASLDATGVESKDTIVFRGIEYTNRDMLLFAVRDAPY